MTNFQTSVNPRQKGQEGQVYTNFNNKFAITKFAEETIKAGRFVKTGTDNKQTKNISATGDVALSKMIGVAIVDNSRPLDYSDLSLGENQLTYNDFKKIGRLGCGRCYEAFKTYLGPLLKRIHGSDIHLGKVPHKKGKAAKAKKIDVEELKKRLRRAVELEEFEEAARLRDEIKKHEDK